MVEHERTGPVDTMNWSFSRITMWGPVLIVAIIFYEVIMRYLFFKPTLWVNEMSLWLGGAIYVTSGLYAMQQRSHIRITVIYDVVPRWLRKVFDLIALLCVLIFIFSVVWGGFGEAAAKFWRWETFGTAYDPPIPATNKPLILATLFVLALQAISNLIRDWPSAAWVRKTFDVLATISIVILTAYALPIIFDTAEGGPLLPMKWRVGIGLTLVVAALLCVLGLVRDFNKTPIIQSIDDEDERAEIEALRASLAQKEINKTART